MWKLSAVKHVLSASLGVHGSPEHVIQSTCEEQVSGGSLAKPSRCLAPRLSADRGLDLLSLSHSGECVRCMFWNNLGCIHFAMGKHNLGIFYFKKALQENDHTCAQLGNCSNSQCESQESLRPLRRRREAVMGHCHRHLCRLQRLMETFLDDSLFRPRRVSRGFCHLQ